MILGRDRKRLEELENRLGELEESYRRVTELEANWEDWLHKIRNVLARLNQRDKTELDGPAPRRPAVSPAAARLLGLHNGGE